MPFKTKNWTKNIIGSYTHNGQVTAFGVTSPYGDSGTAANPARYLQYQSFSRAWFTTDGWRALLAAQGWLPTQPMSEYQWKSWQPYQYSTFNISNSIYQGEVRGTVVFTMPTTLAEVNLDGSGSIIADLLLDAQYKAKSQARDMKSNVAVLFGEGRQTVNMLVQAAQRLGRSYRDFRRGRFRKAADILGIKKPTGSAANHWLEYTYGWAPLVSDCVGLAELAAQHLGLGGRPPRLTCRSVKTYRDHAVLTGTPGPDFFGNLDRYEWKIDEFVAEARAGLLLEVEYTEAATAAQLGFGLYDPLLTAWELTPFSFVFDWFIDVGSWLEQMSSLQGMRVLTGYYSLTYSSKGSVSGGPWTGGIGTWKLQGLVPPGAFSGRSYSRTPWNGGLLSLRMPLKDGLNARRLVTTAALWRQRLRGDRVPGHYRP